MYLDGSILFPLNFLKFGQVTKLSAATGEDTGVVATNGVFSAAVSGGELVTADFTYGSLVPSPMTYRINWRYDAVQSLLSDNPQRPSNHFAIVGDRILWGFGTQARGYAPCGASACSTPAWTTELGGEPIGVAVIDTGFAAYALDTGAVTVVDVTTGAIRWTAEVGASTAPAVAGSNVVVGTADGRVVSLQSASGAEVWEAATGGPVERQPLIGGTVVYAAVDTHIVALDLAGCGGATCTPLATLDAGAAVTGGPIFDTGRVIAGTADGRVVAFGLPAG